MKAFLVFFKIDARLFFSKRNNWIMIAFIVISLVFVQLGIGKFKGLETSKREFQIFEQKKVASFKDYAYYGTVGFRLIFVPPPTFVYFDNTAGISESISQLHSGDVLYIYKSHQGKQILIPKSGEYNDLSGLIFVFGSLLTLYLGYDSFLRREFVKTLSSMAGFGKLFSYILISRMILITGVILVLYGAAVVLALTNGIGFPGEALAHLLFFLLLTTLLMYFFYALGVLTVSLNFTSMGVWGW